MNNIKGLLVLLLIGCSGPDFTAAQAVETPGGAGKDDQSLAGEAGEFNSGGTSNTEAGTSSGGTMNNAGSNLGGSAGSETTAGTTNGGTSEGGTSMVTAGSAGMAGSMGGTSTVNSCTSAGKQFACGDAQYNGAPAPYAFECTETTAEPPSSIIVPEGNINTWRQCVESNFGSPSSVWCCTRS